MHKLVKENFVFWNGQGLFWDSFLKFGCFPVYKGQTEVGQGVPGLQDSSRGYHRTTCKEASCTAEGAMGKGSILDKKDELSVCNSFFHKCLFYFFTVLGIWKNAERMGWNFLTQTYLSRQCLDGKHKFSDTQVFYECVLLSPHVLY